MASCQSVKEELVVSQQLSYEEKSNVDEIIQHAENLYVSEDIENKSLAIVAQNENERIDNNVLGIHANALGIQAKVGLSAQGKVAVGNQGKIALNNRITVVAGALKNQTKGGLYVFQRQKWAGHIVKDYPNPLGGTGAFAQSALSNKGVKAAVVYSGKNCAGVECGWLLAWADVKALGKKVYAECGPKSKFCNIDWNKIEKKLNDSKAIVTVRDPKTGTSVYASIVGHSGKDVVAAAFSG